MTKSDSWSERHRTSEDGDPERERTKRQVAADLFGHAFEPVHMGRFALLRVVGEGAMGQVHAAYDERLDRRVALKIIRKDRAFSPTARKRLLREARAMARLSHPNVVALYEGDEHEQQAFLVLEFVDGPTLEAWIEEERPAAEVLEAFIAIGRGLAAAHAAGVVHRDFKPANVLFTAEGIPKVADFGLAALGQHANTESDIERSAEPVDERLTATGQFAGTPLFMAPEQWEGGEADARSDQFSYCLTLYRTLYGVDPFGGESMHARRSAVVDGTPTPPALTGSTPRWLWAPLRKGLSRDPSERFSSMDELLRALTNDPRTRRRRMAMLGGAALVAAGGVAYGPVQASLQTQRCEVASKKIRARWGQDERASAEKALTHSGLPYAADAWKLVSVEIDAFSSAWEANRLEGCLATTLEGTLAPPLSRRSEECFDELRERFEGNLDALAKSDSAIVDQATALFSRLPDPATCIDTTHLAQRADLPDEAEVRQRIRALRAELRAVGRLSWAGKGEQAITRGEAVIEASEAIGWASLIANAHSVLGDAYLFAQEPDQALASFRRTYDIAVASGDDLMALQGISGLMFTLTWGLNEPQHALWWHDIAQPTIDRIQLDSHPDVALVWRYSAMAHQELGNLEQARDGYRAAYALMVESYGEGSSASAALLGDLGDIALAMEDPKTAAEYFRRQRDIVIETRGEHHPELATPLTNLGAAEAGLGHMDIAYGHYVQALGLLETTYGAEDPRSAPLHNNIGDILAQRGELKAAQTAINRGLRIRTKAFGEAHPQTASSQLYLAGVEEQLGHLEVALDLFARAHATYADNDPTGDRALAALEGRARTQRAQGNTADADTLDAELAQLREEETANATNP